MATPASTVAIKQEPLDDWTDATERSASGTAVPSTDIAVDTTSNSRSSSTTTTTLLATGEPTKAESAAGTTQLTGLAAPRTVYTVTSSGASLQKTSSAPARVISNPGFKPLNFTLQISQGGGLRLASPGATSLSGTTGGSNTIKNSANSGGGSSSSSSSFGKSDDQIFFIRHIPKGTPQLCMSFKSDPSKLYVLQALAGQQLNLKVSSAQQTGSTIPFVKVLANPKQGTVKDSKELYGGRSSAQSPTAGMGKSAESALIHNRPQAVIGRQTAAPLRSRSLLKPRPRSSVIQTVDLADSTQERTHSAGMPVHSFGSSSSGPSTPSSKLSAGGQSGFDSVKRFSKEPAVLRRPKAKKRKPEAVSLLQNALKKCRSSDDTTAEAATAKLKESSEATDSASEAEEEESEKEEESDCAFPFKIDSVFSLASDSSQQTILWDEAGDSKIEEGGQSEDKPVKVVGSSFTPFYNLTKEELLTLCGSSFVVIERLDEKDIGLLKRAGKTSGQETSSHERCRCSDYCRKRTLNYLCMLNLIRCREPKRRRVKTETYDLKSEPDADPDCSSGIEKSGLHSALDSDWSGTSATKEAVTSRVNNVTAVATKETCSLSETSDAALDADSNSAAVRDRPPRPTTSGGTCADITVHVTSQPPFVSSLSDEGFVLPCSQPVEADTVKGITIGTVFSETAAEKTGGASESVQETSETSQGSSNESQKASETPPQSSSSNVLHDEASGPSRETSSEASSTSHEPSNVVPEISRNEDSEPHPGPVVPSKSYDQIPALLQPQVREMTGISDTDQSPCEEKIPTPLPQENPASAAASVETSKLLAMSAKLAPASASMLNVAGTPETPSLGTVTPDVALTGTKSTPGCTAVAGASSMASLVESSTPAAPTDRTTDQPFVAASSVEEKTTTSLPGSSAVYLRANTTASNQPSVSCTAEAKTSAATFVFPAVQTFTAPATTTTTTSSATFLSSLINDAIAAAPSVVAAAGVEGPTSAAGSGQSADGAGVLPSAASAPTTAVSTHAELPPYALILPSVQSSGGPVVLILPCGTGHNAPISGCAVTASIQLPPPVQSPAPLTVTSGAAVNNLSPFSPIPALPALAQKSKVIPPSTDTPLNPSPAISVCNPVPPQAGEAKDSSSATLKQPSSSSLAPTSPVLLVVSGATTDAAKAGVACPASSGTLPSATSLPYPPDTAASLSTVSGVSASTMSQPTPTAADTNIVSPDGKLLTIPGASQAPGRTSGGESIKTLPCLGSRGMDASSPLTTVFVMSGGSSTGCRQTASSASTSKMKMTPSVCTVGLQKGHSLVSLIKTPALRSAITKSSKNAPAGPQTLGVLRSALLGSIRLQNPPKATTATTATTKTVVNTLTTSMTTARTATPTTTTTTVVRTATPSRTTKTKKRTSSSSSLSSNLTSPPPARILQAVRGPDGSLTFLNAPPPGTGQLQMPFKVILKPSKAPLGGAVGSSSGSAKTAGEETLRKQLNTAIVMPPESLTRAKHSPSTPSSSSVSLESSSQSAGPSETPFFPSLSSPSSADPPRPLSSRSLLPSSYARTLVRPSESAAKKSSAAGSDSESRARRTRLESRYPLPPGVVIKTEPETFGYPTDPVEPAETDSWFSVGDAAASAQQLEPLYTPAVSTPAGTCRLEEEQRESTTVARGDRGESAVPVGPVSSDPGYPDFDVPQTDGDASVDDDEPPVLSPVAPLSPSCRDEDVQQQDEDDLVHESPPAGDGSTHELASLHSRTDRSHAGSSVMCRSRAGRVISQRQAETGLFGESLGNPKSSPKANPKTRPSSSSERRISRTGSRRKGSGEAERQAGSSASSFSTLAPPALVAEYPFTSSPIVSFSASSTLSEISSRASSSSSSSNDRIRRLKEMLKHQNEQLEQIRRERAMQPPLFPMDD